MFRILSIDGGGLRGIIPIQVLKQVESMTGKSIADSFDLIAGTSTGGILACGLTVKEHDTKKSLYTLDKLEEIYKTDGKAIFPPPKFYTGLKQYTGPKFSNEGLRKTLNKYFDGKSLRDCRKPILVSSYDLHHNKAHYFSTRFIHPLSHEYDVQKNFSLTDICLATSAAPTYFPSHGMKFLDGNENHVQHNFIDGGVFVNNPSMAAIAEVLNHRTDVLYNKIEDTEERLRNPININDIHLLSIGTGKTLKQISGKDSEKWGPIGWGRPVINVMMQGNSQSVHHQTETLLNTRYMRINMDIEEDISEMDDSTNATTEKLLTETNRLIINNGSILDKLAKFVKNSNL